MISALLLWIAGIVGSLLLLLLLLPFRIKLQGWADMPDQAAFNISAAWGWGLIGVEKPAAQPLRLRLLGFPVCRISLSDAKKEKKKKSKKEKKSPTAKMNAVRIHFKTMTRVIGRLVKATFPRGYVTGRIGLSDPADTAVIAVLSHFFQPTWKYFQIEVTPSYEEEVLLIATEAQVTVVIGYVVLTLLLLLFQKQTRMMLYSLRHA